MEEENIHKLKVNMDSKGSCWEWNLSSFWNLCSTKCSSSVMRVVTLHSDLENGSLPVLPARWR